MNRAGFLTGCVMIRAASVTRKIVRDLLPITAASMCWICLSGFQHQIMYQISQENRIHLVKEWQWLYPACINFLDY